MNSQLTRTSFFQIKEILDKRSENDRVSFLVFSLFLEDELSPQLSYLVILKETQDEGSEFWLLASEIKGDITSLTGLGRSGRLVYRSSTFQL